MPVVKKKPSAKAQESVAKHRVNGDVKQHTRAVNRKLKQRGLRGEDSLPIIVELNDEIEAERISGSTPTQRGAGRDIPEADQTVISTVQQRYREDGCTFDEVKKLWVDPNGIPLPGQPGVKLTYEQLKALRPGRQLKTDEKIQDQRIQEIRMLLSYNMIKRDIVRLCAEKWQKKPKYLWKMIRVAQDRNLAHINQTPEQVKSNSLQFWTHLLQDAAARKQRAIIELGKADEFLRQCKETLDQAKLSTDTERIKYATQLVRSAERLKDHGRKMIVGAQMQMEQVQDRVDRLFGNYAPERVAVLNLNVDAKDNQPEPLTRADADQELMEQLGGLLKGLTQEQRVKLLTQAGIPVGQVLETTCDPVPDVPITIVDE